MRGLSPERVRDIYRGGERQIILYTPVRGLSPDSVRDLQRECKRQIYTPIRGLSHESVRDLERGGLEIQTHKDLAPPCV